MFHTVYCIVLYILLNTCTQARIFVTLNWTLCTVVLVCPTVCGTMMWHLITVIWWISLDIKKTTTEKIWTSIIQHIIECRTSHLAARMIWRKVLEEHPFWEGGGLVWCEPDDHLFFWSIHSAKFSSIQPFLPIILLLIL